MNKKLPLLSRKENVPIKKIFDDVSQLIQQGQAYAAREVNSAMVLLYWSIGKRINDDILLEKRASYGEQIINILSEQLSAQFGRGYNRSSLFRMVIFARNYSDSQIGWGYKEFHLAALPHHRTCGSRIRRLNKTKLLAIS